MISRCYYLFAIWQESGAGAFMRYPPNKSLCGWKFRDNFSENYSAKRVLDIFLASIGSTVFLPLAALIFFSIYMEDGHPVFFLQRRVGENNRSFKIIKFRSMVKGAESKTQGLRDKDIPKGVVTKCGRFIRNSALDELPQLINILKGEMSFVGPRAILPSEISVLSLFQQKARLSLKPGLTGLAQIYGRDDITSAQKLRFDLIYLKRKSIWLDLKLIFLSVYITIKGKWKEKRKKF